MLMRLRLPELLKEHDVTAYRLAKESGGRISLSTIYRLTRQKGRVESFDAETLEALCEVLKVGPAEILELEPRRGRRA